MTSNYKVVQFIPTEYLYFFKTCSRDLVVVTIYILSINQMSMTQTRVKLLKEIFIFECLRGDQQYKIKKWYPFEKVKPLPEAQFARYVAIASFSNT